jgi:hypothetical protein
MINFCKVNIQSYNYTALSVLTKSQIKNLYPFFFLFVTEKKIKLLHTYFLPVSSKSVGGDFVLQQQVK